MKIKILKIGTVLFSLSLIGFFVMGPNIRAYFSGSKSAFSTFKDGRPIEDINFADDSEIDLKKPLPLLQFNLDEKIERSLTMGKFPQFSAEDRQKINEKIGSLPENLLVETTEKYTWNFNLGEKKFLFKKELNLLSLYEIQTTTSVKNPSIKTVETKK